MRHVDVLEKGAIHVVRLLLDRGAKLEQLVGDGLFGALEDVDQAARVSLVLDREESVRLARLACAAGSANAVDVVFDGEGELPGS